MDHLPANPLRCYHSLAWLLTACVLGTLLLRPHLSFAQGHALTVTVRDGAGQPVAAITVLVRSLEGVVLARRQTDDQGQARFTLLPATVLVQVSGQPRSGPPLYQVGNDATGVLLTLDPGGNPTVFDLRVEPDGMVLPDPLTMIDLQEGGPTVVGAGEYIPTLPLATPFVVPSMPAGGVAEVVVEAGPDTPEPTPAWTPVVTLLLLGLAVVGLFFLHRRRTA
jgi:MYXO-CTERM domain-containing protein